MSELRLAAFFVADGRKEAEPSRAEARWPPSLRGKTNLLAFQGFFKEGDYLSSARPRGRDCSHGCAPSTCVRKPFRRF